MGGGRGGGHRESHQKLLGNIQRGDGLNFTLFSPKSSSVHHWLKWYHWKPLGGPDNKTCVHLRFRTVTNTSYSIFLFLIYYVFKKHLTPYLYTKLQMSSHIFKFSEWNVFVLSMLKTFDSSRTKQDCNCFLVASATKSPPVAKWRKWFTKFVKFKWPSSFSWRSCNVSWSLNLLQ